MRRTTVVSNAWMASVVALVVMALSTTAWADGDDKKAPDFSAHSEVEEVADELDELWREQPEHFRQLSEIRWKVVELEVRMGPRPVPVVRMLRGLDDEAFLAMLWALADDDPMQLGMGLSAWRQWQIGLIETVGRLRDRRALPVLQSIVAESNPHEQTHTAAVKAIGRIGDQDAIDQVIDVARTSPEKRGAVIAGLGMARRINALNYLLEVAQDSDQQTHHLATVRALGDWANQFAWETSALDDHLDEREQGVQAIVELLVAAYPNADQRLRDEIEKSLQLADAERAKQRALERAGKVDGPERQRLEQLGEAMADSPLD